MIVLAIVLTVLFIWAGLLAVLGVMTVNPGGYLFLWGAVGWTLALAAILAQERTT